MSNRNPLRFRDIDGGMWVKGHGQVSVTILKHRFSSRRGTGMTTVSLFKFQKDKVSGRAAVSRGPRIFQIH